MRAWDESLDGVGMFVEKFDVETDADDGIDAGLGDLVLLGISQRLGFILLRSERRAIRNRPRIAAIVRMAKDSDEFIQAQTLEAGSGQKTGNSGRGKGF